MAERKPRTRNPTKPAETKAPAQESKAQAEFARYKQRVQQTADASAQAASFASPLPMGAIPAWSLQPSPVVGGPPGAGAVAWGPGSSTGGSPSITQGLGTTIRLGVDVLNAALSSSIMLLGGAGEAFGGAAWPRASTSCGCDACCDCCGQGACDCCCVMDCGCGSYGCCEPSVGTCC
jgi:hypothetical protein